MACWTDPGTSRPGTAQCRSSQTLVLEPLWKQTNKEAFNYGSNSCNKLLLFLLLSYLSVFFFIAGTISVFMSTLRSNLRLKHSLLGSCRGNGHTVSLHRWGCSFTGPPRACAVCEQIHRGGGSFSRHCLTQTTSCLGDTTILHQCYTE